MRQLGTLLFTVLFSASAYASCGSSSCPLDLHALSTANDHRFSLNLTFEYIDQDQPRAGTHSTTIGALPSHHDEVRTVNRTATMHFSWNAREWFQVSAMLPFVSRSHDHLASSHEHGGSQAVQHNVIPEHWNVHGPGDLQLQARARVAKNVWLISGIELPTGAEARHNTDGEFAEVPIQPGSGSTDLLAGISWEKLGRVPLFAAATYRRNGSGSRDYRFGNEWQFNAGGAYPIARTVDILLQANARVKAKDLEEGARDAFTGGTYLYASPGIRWTYRGTSLYALVQIPVRQDVNGLQLTSRNNVMTGIQTRF